MTAFKKSDEAVPEKNLLLLAGAPMLLLFWSESLLWQNLIRSLEF